MLEKKTSCIVIALLLSCFSVGQAKMLPNACVDDKGVAIECKEGQQPTICVDSDYNIIDCNESQIEEPINSNEKPIKDINDSINGNDLQFWVDLIGKLLVPIAAALLGAFATNYKQKMDYKPKKIKKGHRKNTVLQIGVGRSGKTELVKTLSDPLGQGRAELTNNFDIHSFSAVDKDNITINYDITDYRGQDFAQLISNFIQEQLLPKTKLRYDDINSLILMVDLFRYIEDDPIEKSFDELDSERIDEQIQEWNRTALDAVFGLLTKESLNYVCLFINKIDKWATPLNDYEKAEAAKRAFSPLIDDLNKRTTNTNAHTPKENVTFEVVVGSSIFGKGVVGESGLLPNLAKHSIPMNIG